MHRIFKKKEILTIPNMLSFFRLALIPVIVWLYCGLKNYYAAIGVIVLSGISDIADGFIARKFQMVSDFGKILDPIADKLTQAALLVCLISKYKLMWGLLVVFVVREISMLTMGAVVIKKKDSVNSSKWYGKLNTVIIYGVMIVLIMFPNISELFANILLILCAVVMLISLVLYARFYYRILHDDKKVKGRKE